MPVETSRICGLISTPRSSRLLVKIHKPGLQPLKQAAQAGRRSAASRRYCKPALANFSSISRDQAWPSFAPTNSQALRHCSPCMSGSISRKRSALHLTPEDMGKAHAARSRHRRTGKSNHGAAGFCVKLDLPARTLDLRFGSAIRAANLHPDRTWAQARAWPSLQAKAPRSPAFLGLGFPARILFTLKLLRGCLVVFPERFAMSSGENGRKQRAQAWAASCWQRLAGQCRTGWRYPQAPACRPQLFRMLAIKPSARSWCDELPPRTMPFWVMIGGPFVAEASVETTKAGS